MSVLSNPLQFILAGNATFTVKSLKTGVHYTYKVQRAEPVNGQSIGWFVKYLSGSNNETDYTYLGMVSDSTMEFVLTRKSKLLVTSTPVVAFTWLLKKLKNGQQLPNAEVWHAGKCGRCGRKLTVPESIQTGFGPECATLVQ